MKRRLHPLLLSTLVAPLLFSCIMVEISVNPRGEIAMVREDKILIFHPDHGIRTELDRPEAGKPQLMVFSPSGDRLAVTSDLEGRQALGVIDLSTGAYRRLGTYPGLVFYPRWSPRGDALSFVLAEEDLSSRPDEESRVSLRIVGLGKDGAPENERALVSSCGIWHAWKSDDELVAAVFKKPVSLTSPQLATLSVIDRHTGKTDPVVRVLATGYEQVRMSRDRRRIHFCAFDGRLPFRASRQDQPFAHFTHDLETDRLLRVSAPGEVVRYSVEDPTGGRTAYLARSGKKKDSIRLWVRSESAPPVEIGVATDTLAPFWIDENRVVWQGKRGGKETVLIHDVRTGDTVDFGPELVPPPVRIESGNGAR